MKKLIANVFLVSCLPVSSPGFAQTRNCVQPSGKATVKHEFRYTNPVIRDTSISMRHHYIIKVGNKWYCTGNSNAVWKRLNPGVRLPATILFMKKGPYPYSQTFKTWTYTPPLEYETVYYKDGSAYIKGTSRTEQVIDY